MKILDIINEDLIKPDLTATSKDEALTELAELIASKEGLDEDTIVGVLREREKLGSTGIGDGIAIPHGKLKGLKKLVASFGRSKKGIDFQSIDGKPTHLFFLLMAPENTAGVHLKALARISRLLKDKKFRESLLDASNTEGIFQALKDQDEKL
jgi:PTS system nitrogen regulatory IIA component